MRAREEKCCLRPCMTSSVRETCFWMRSHCKHRLEEESHQFIFSAKSNSRNLCTPTSSKQTNRKTDSCTHTVVIKRDDDRDSLRRASSLEPECTLRACRNWKGPSRHHEGQFRSPTSELTLERASHWRDLRLSLTAPQLQTQCDAATSQD